jgi:segregation and condensation protein B
MQHLHAGIEAILMVVDEPVTPVDLATALDVPEPEVIVALHSLRDD